MVLKSQYFNKRFLKQLLAAVLANLSIMIAELHFCSVEPIAIYLISEESEIKNITLEDISWLSSMVALSAALFALIQGYLMDWLGRKYALLIIGPLSSISFLLLIFTRDVIVFYIVRVLQGFAIVSSYVIAPVYVSEIASADVTGTLGGLQPLFMSLGFLYVNFAGSTFSYDNYFYALLIIPIIFLISFIFMPETPHYYLMKKNREGAKQSLMWLRAKDNVDEEMEQIENAVNKDMENKAEWKDLFARKSDRRDFFIAFGASATSYENGARVLITLATITFAQSGISLFTPEQLSTAMSITLFIAALLSLQLSDDVGRRPLLIYSSIGATLANILSTLYYVLYEKMNVHCKSLEWLLYVGTFGLGIITTMGLKNLIPTIRAEFFPSHTRVKGNSLIIFLAFILIFIDLKMFQTVIDTFGIYFNFLWFTLVSFMSYFLIYKLVIESEVKTLHQVNIN